MEHNIKLSILVPVYNAERYLRKCLDSIAAQTFPDFEVLCLNDGSTDSSAGIIAEYAQKDPRFVLINKSNSGYGHTLNQGLDLAKGEYIGIVEADDFAEPDLYEKLYRCAETDHLDAVKAGFYYYWSGSNGTPEKNIPEPVCSTALSKRILCPVRDFKAARELVSFFNFKPSIWSGLYRRSFLCEHGIRFTETPGASYQDTAFNFKVWFCAEKIRLLSDCLLHYRQDNESSSIKSAEKVYCVCDEYEEIEQFMRRYPRRKAIMDPVCARLRFDTYDWNYKRLPEELAAQFMIRFHEDFVRLNLEGNIQQAYFGLYHWTEVCSIIENTPDFSHRRRQAEKNGVPFTDGGSGEKGGLLRRIWKKLAGGYWCYHEHGFRYTLSRVLEKIIKKLEG